MRFQHNPFTDRLDISGMGPGSTVAEFLTGNDGIPVAPDAGYNINVLGNNTQGINITGNAGTSTLTVAGIDATTAQKGVQANATNIQATAQAATNVSLTPSNITSLFSSSPLPASQGGTGLSSPAANQLLATNGSSAFTPLGVATNGQIPIGSVGSDPVLATLTAGTGISITNGPGSITVTATGADNTFSADSGTAIPVAGVVNLNGTSAQGISTSASGNTVTWTIANATTGQKGVVALATNAEAIAGTDTAKAITADDLKAKLGTQTSNGFAFGAGTSSAISWTTEPTNGQLPIGSTGNQPVLATLTAGAGISITNGAGSITIASTGEAATWNLITTNQTLAVNNGYVVTSGTLSLALPATSAVGDEIELTLDGGTSWTLTQGVGQQIRFGSTQTTAGVGGSLASTAQGDAIRLICTVANTRWNILSSIGNITVV